MKRKPNGCGTVKELKDSPRLRPFRAMSPRVWVNGKYKSILIGDFETRLEAEDALAMWRRSRGTKDNFTLAELYEEWSERGYEKISKSTADCYRAAWKQMVDLHNLKVNVIRTGHFQTIIDIMQKSGKSYSAIHNVQILAGLLEDYAMQYDIVEKNYARFVDMPKKPETTKEAFTEDQIRLIEMAAEEGDYTAKLVMVLCYTGWRIGEFLNLKIEDYDSENHFFKGGLKTDAGKNRIVPVHPKAQAYVDELIAMNGPQLVCRQEIRGRKPHQYTQLVPVTTGYFRNDMFAPLMERLGITDSKGEAFTPHATRHTFATACRKQGVDPVVVKQLMGHSKGNDVTESVYTHIDLDMLVNAIKAIIFYQANKN